MIASITQFLQDNHDYLALLAAFAIVFALLEVALRKLRDCRLPLVVWLIVIGIAAGGYWSTHQAGERARENIERIVESLAPTYAAELQRMGHAKLTSQTAPEDPLYLSMVDAILHWQRLNRFAHDIYTIRKLPDGSNVFIVDPETDYNHDGKFEGETEARTEIGTVFEEADAGMESAFRGTANFNREIVKDEWGEWVGAWAPLFGTDGKVEAVLGVDFHAREWRAATSAARTEALSRIALLAIIVAISGAFIGILRADVARRALAEARSRAAEERMALTLKRMPLGFVEWSTFAECLTWNPAAERIFGHKADDVLGKRIFPLIVAPGAREHVDRIWAALLTQGGGTHSINDNLTKDGRLITCEWFNTPLLAAEGKVTGIFSIVQDITERVSLEKHVQQSQRLNAVGQLAAGVAHDFNNILTIITGHTGLLLSEGTLPMSARPDVERIEDAAIRASGLTRQLLAFSRQHAIFPRPLNLGEVVENSASMLGRILGDDVAFNVGTDTATPPIEGDPALLDQVITNLVLNSRDALPRGGVIEVRSGPAEVTPAQAALNPDARPGLAACLTVRDNGTGIPAEHLDHIFEPFFTTKHPGKGTGLGLSVVHGIVKQHHGWIEVQSAPGNGTEFRIFFPPTEKIPTAEAAHFSPEPAVPRTGSRKTILMAEDEAIVREIARLILERAGYRVIEAADGVEALKLWIHHSHEVDLLITDMVMPNGVSGRDLALRLLAERPDLPAIYASGYSKELTAPDFLETEKHVFLPKPYLTDHLLSTVRKCLGDTGTTPPPPGSFTATAGI